jgi:hypothetical protein
VARDAGAKRGYVCATHGVLCGPAIDNLRQAAIDQIFITDSFAKGQGLFEQGTLPGHLLSQPFGEGRARARPPPLPQRFSTAIGITR